MAEHGASLKQFAPSLVSWVWKPSRMAETAAVTQQQRPGTPQYGTRRMHHFIIVICHTIWRNFPGCLRRTHLAASCGRGRPLTGQVRRYRRRDGTTTFSLRVRAYRERFTVALGSELDGWSEARADVELAHVCAQIRAGIWEPPRPRKGGDQPEPTFHEYASLWLRGRVAEGIADNTRKDLRRQRSNHLLPFFGRYLVSEITVGHVEEFKKRKLAEREQVTNAAAAATILLGADERPRRALSNTSITKFLVLLARILNAAMRRGWIAANPAAGIYRRRVRRSKGAILEADELESLIVAAGHNDRRRPNSAERRRQVRMLRDERQLAWREIGARLGVASSTAVYLYRQTEPDTLEDGRRRSSQPSAAAGCEPRRPYVKPRRSSAPPYLSWRPAAPSERICFPRKNGVGHGREHRGPRRPRQGN